jgi:hypothetical protein
VSGRRFTLADLVAYTGGEWDGRLRYFATRGDHYVTGWSGSVGGSEGWWWAITRSVGGDDVVVGMGWSMGLSGVGRNADIARALAGLAEGPREAAS